MPDTKNVTKQVQSVSPYNPSINSSLLQNNVDTSLNGTPSTTQKISEVELNTKDFGDINQSQKQDGFFVSITDKIPIYSISPEVLALNDIKKLEEEIGVPYTFLSRTVAQQKAAQVKNDFLPKNKTFSLSEDSTSSRIDAIDAELGYDRDGNRVYRKNVNTKWDYISRMKGYTTHRGTSKNVGGDFNLENLSYSVIIEESREGTRSYKDINDGGFFSGADKDVASLQNTVTIKVLSNVQNFSFGTSQSFDPVEPRGSQSPLYFYKNNGGRTLGFTAEFYQQEYPKEPLLSIAEKAQYLARPYRHGDYAVIPKLVKITIPGRSFRGYLTNVSVTYSADMGDYRNWDRDKVVSALNAASTETVSGSIINNNGKINIETNVNGLIGGNYNTAETMNYGLGKMSIDFTLAIVEEIRLTVYETVAEVQAREDVLRYEYEQQQNRKEIDKQLGEAGQFLYTYPYSGLSPSDLILVDKDGKYVTYIYNSQNGTIIDQQDWPPGCVTLAEYEQEQELKRAYEMNNKQSPNAPYNTDEKVIEDNLGEYSKEYLIDRLIKEKKENDPDITEEQEKQLREEYRNKSMGQVAEEYKKDVLSKECNDEEKSKFLVKNTSVKGGTLQISMPESLRQFLTKPINTIKDAQDVLNFLGTGGTWEFDAEIDLQQIEDYGIDDRWDWKIIVEICCEAGLDLNMDWNGSKNKYGIGYAGQGAATTGNCGFVIDDRFAFSSDPKKDETYKKKFKEGSTSVSRGGKPKRIWTFHKICTDWPSDDFIINLDKSDNKIKDDTTIRDHVIMSIKAVRDAFYKGFNKLCEKEVTEKGAKLFNNEDECIKYMKESGVSISYYWEYDGLAKHKGNNPTK